MDQSDLLRCAFVCRQWCTLIQPRLRQTLVLNGVSSWGYSLSNVKIASKLHYLQELKEHLIRPYTLSFVNMNNAQLKRLCGAFSAEFLQAVDYIKELKLESCQVKWITLVDFIQHFKSLSSFSDNMSSHYMVRAESCFSCVGTRSRRKLQQLLKREAFSDLQTQFKHLKKLTIRREFVDLELISYLMVLCTKVFRLQELTLVIRRELRTTEKSHIFTHVSKLVYQLRKLLYQNRKTITCLHFEWRDPAYGNFLGKAMEIMGNMRFPLLSSLTLRFDRSQIPSHVERLVPFLRSHFKAKLRSIVLERIVLGPHWEPILTELNGLMLRNPKFRPKMSIDMEISDCYGLKVAAQNKNILQLPLLLKYTGMLTATIENEKTESLSQLLPVDLSKQYRQVSKVIIRVNGQACPNGYPNFVDFSFESITFNFPNLTELYLLDEITKTSTFGDLEMIPLSGVVITDHALQLIVAISVNLRVLHLRGDLSGVTDYSICGIHPEDALRILSYAMEENDEIEFLHEIAPNLSHLKGVIHFEHFKLFILWSGSIF